MVRSVLLGASRNPLLNRFMAAQGLRLGASRFVAGETLDDFVVVARALNAAGFGVAAGILGEGVLEERETRRVVDEYHGLLHRLNAEGLNGTIALKLTHLGLEIDEPLAATNLAELVAEAGVLSRFVRMDMEESRYVDATLRIYRELRTAGNENVGTVLQAYLYRTADDLAMLLPLRPNLRLVKGAYLEPASLAYAHKADVDRAYKALIEQALVGEGFTAIATHDEDAIAHAIAVARSRRITPAGRFEFQLLYGVRPALQRRLVAEGYPVRIAAPYGRFWYPYFMRRLAERPANVAFILRSLWKG